MTAAEQAHLPLVSYRLVMCNRAPLQLFGANNLGAFKVMTPVQSLAARPAPSLCDLAGYRGHAAWMTPASSLACRAGTVGSCRWCWRRSCSASSRRASPRGPCHPPPAPRPRYESSHAPRISLTAHARQRSVLRSRSCLIILCACLQGAQLSTGDLCAHAVTLFDQARELLQSLCSAPAFGGEPSISQT